MMYNVWNLVKSRKILFQGLKIIRWYVGNVLNRISGFTLNNIEFI